MSPVLARQEPTAAGIVIRDHSVADIKGHMAFYLDRVAITASPNESFLAWTDLSERRPSR
jgi:hypothetical protein